MKHIRKVSAAAVALLFGLFVRAFDLPSVPPELQTPSSRADYIGLHFWDNMDFCSPEAENADSMAQNMANFLSVFPVMSGDSARTEAVASAVRKARVTDKSAYMFSQTAEEYLFGSGSPMRDDRLYTVFLREMLEAAYPDSVRSAWMLDMASKNLPGTQVADFVFSDRAGAKHRLSEELGAPVVLFFYDPECDDCHRAAAKLADDFLLRIRIEDGRVKIIAINPAEEEPWRAIPQNFPDAWIDGNDNGVLDESGAFLFSSYPTIYLLDPEGKVLLKEPSVDELLDAVYKL